MKKIEETYHVSNNDPGVFYNQLMNAISKLQNDGQEVELQYSTNVSEHIKGGIVYSVLIIGRK